MTPRPISPDTIDITPADISSAATTFAHQQTTVGTVWSTLGDALAGTRGMAGDDDAAHHFASRYEPAADAAWNAFQAAFRVLGGVADGLVTTANNYLKAEHHSTAGSTGAPEQFPSPVIASDMGVGSPSASLGPSHSSVPSWLINNWPAGDSGQLRAAAAAWHSARDGVHDVTMTLGATVRSITDYNHSACLHAMSEFWDSLAKPGDRTAILSALHAMCDDIGTACDRYAQAIDDSRNAIQNALISAGIAVGLTTILGAALSVFSFGGSDVAAGAADVAEVEAIVGPVMGEFEATVASEVDGAVAADAASSLDSVANAVPDIDTAEADTSDVDAAVDEELNADNGAPTKEPAAPTEPAQQVDKFDANGFHNNKTAQLHFKKHGSDFGDTSVEQYQGDAESFLKDAQAQGYPARVDPATGRVRVYDPATNTFGVYDSDGSVVTYYKPTSPTYWDSNSGSWGNPVKWK